MHFEKQGTLIMLLAFKYEQVWYTGLSKIPQPETGNQLSSGRIKSFLLHLIFFKKSWPYHSRRASSRARGLFVVFLLGGGGGGSERNEPASKEQALGLWVWDFFWMKGPFPPPHALPLKKTCRDLSLYYTLR